MTWDIQTSPQELALLMEAGFVYRYARRFEQARETFQGVLALLPQNEIEIALAGVSFDEGQYESAMEHSMRAILMNPRSALAYAQLGEIQIFQHKKHSARTSLRKAIELDPAGHDGTLARTLLILLDAVDVK
jgi:tetratricopeptide (TPR) repeat protein